MPFRLLSAALLMVSAALCALPARAQSVDAEPAPTEPVPTGPAITEPVPAAIPIIRFPPPIPVIEVRRVEATPVYVVPPEPALPAPVRAMIDAAVESGDRGKVDTVVQFAKATNPDWADDIEVLHDAFLKRYRARVAAEARAKELALRQAGLFDYWKGRGEIGGFQSTGNSENIGITASLSLERTGIDWEHRVRARADFQRSNGSTTREQYLASYEPRYSINPRLFSYALAQYESDRFQGYDSRFSASGGFGYQVVDTPSLDLSLKAGPAWRQTQFVSGDRQSSFGGLAGLDFDWRIIPELTLTQDANLVAASGGSAVAIIDSQSSTLHIATGLEAKITEGLTTRLSYTVDHNSNPPEGAVATDTQTRFSLVYGF